MNGCKNCTDIYCDACWAIVDAALSLGDEEECLSEEACEFSHAPPEWDSLVERANTGDLRYA